MPAAAVRRRERALSIMTGRIGFVDSYVLLHTKDQTESWKSLQDSITRGKERKVECCKEGWYLEICNGILMCTGDFPVFYYHWGTKVWGANRIRDPGSPHPQTWVLRGKNNLLRKSESMKHSAGGVRPQG